jgi:hypothetical protein
MHHTIIQNYATRQTMKRRDDTHASDANV